MAAHQVQLDQCLQKVCCAEAKGSSCNARGEALWWPVPEQDTVPRKHTPSLCVENRAALSWKKTASHLQRRPRKAPAQPSQPPALRLPADSAPLAPGWKDSNHSLAQLEPHSGFCSPSCPSASGLRLQPPSSPCPKALWAKIKLLPSTCF